MNKQNWLFIGITGIFLCLLIGIFVGRNLTRNYIFLNSDSDSNTTDSTQDINISDGRIDINTATLQQLQLLPGIGEVTAQRILDYRAEHGSFSSPQELMNVNGIGDKKFAQIEPYVKVGGSYENSGS